MEIFISLNRKPAPCWVSLKASAGVELRCDGGGSCEQAEPEARRCPGRGCFVASPGRQQARAFGGELWKCALVFLFGSSLVVEIACRSFYHFLRNDGFPFGNTNGYGRNVVSERNE